MAGIDRILIVDDEPVLRDVLSTLLEQHGYVTHPAVSASEALAVLGEEEVDLVLLDLMLPDTSGLEVLPEIKAFDPQIPVIMMTAYSSVESAIEAMRLGAFHYVPKPFKHEEVLHIIRQALERRRLQAENLRLKSRLEGMGEIIGTSRAMQEVFELVRRAAPARSNILVVGESGTGKELVARAVHRLSPRADKPFIPVHTSAIPTDLLESTLFGHVKGAFTGAVASKRGLFEAAHEGTLFLDEVGTISPDTQTKLLRVIQEREFCRVGSVSPLTVDVRFISATNVSLWEEVQAGRFREDLFYRLNVISIELPPLRDRREDVPILATHFLKTYAEENDRPVEGFETEAMDAIVSYAWPGNVRELENVVERAVVLCRGSTIGVDLLPPPLRERGETPRLVEEVGQEGIDFKAAVADYQRRLIQAALERADGVQRQAARLLSVSPTTLNEMIRRLGIGNGP
jgi:DNA-binding NtrC family response regulator